MEQPVYSGATKPPQKREGAMPTEAFYRQTPLERVVGFKCAETTYDLLNFREQLIIDLLATEWTQTQIASIFEVSQPSIAASIRRIRFKLADSELRLTLDLRQNYREYRPAAI